MKALRDILQTESESVRTAIQDVNTDCRWFTTLLYDTAQILRGPVYLQTIEFSTVFKANLESGLAMFRTELQMAIAQHIPEEKRFIRTRRGYLFFSMYNAEILLDNVTMRADNATVFVEDENTTIHSPLDMTLDGGTLSSASLSVWLPDEQFWDHSTDIWLKLATIRFVTTHLVSQSRI